MGVADGSLAVLSPQHPLLVSSCPIPFESFFRTAAAKNAKMVVYCSVELNCCLQKALDLKFQQRGL